MGQRIKIPHGVIIAAFGSFGMVFRQNKGALQFDERRVLLQGGVVLHRRKDLF